MASRSHNTAVEIFQYNILQYNTIYTTFVQHNTIVIQYSLYTIFFSIQSKNSLEYVDNIFLFKVQAILNFCLSWVGNVFSVFILRLRHLIRTTSGTSG